MKTLLNKKVLTAIITMVAIFYNSAFASVYLGAGVGLSHTSYKSSETNIASKGNSKAINNQYILLSRAISSKFLFNGSQEQFNDQIYASFPKDSSDMAFYIQFALGNNTFGSVCANNDVIKDPQLYPPTTSCVPNNPNAPTPTAFNLGTGNSSQAVAMIETDFGRAVGGFFIQKLSPQLVVRFATIEEEYAFYNKLGKDMLTALIGKTNYSRDDIYNILNQSIFFETGQQTLQLTQFGDDEREDFVKLQEVMINAFGDLGLTFANNTSSSGGLTGPQLQELISIDSSASKNGAQIFLLAGIGKAIQRAYLGAEFALDIGKDSVGKNSQKQINVKSYYTASLIGKLGYSFTKNSLNYLNIGIASRKYNTKYQGNLISFSDTSFNLHLLLGIGMEFFISKKLGIFAELNHIVSANDVKTGSPDNRALNVATSQVKLGVKYYLDQNPFANNNGKYYNDSSSNSRRNEGSGKSNKNGSGSNSNNGGKNGDDNNGSGKNGKNGTTGDGYDIEHETKIIIKGKKDGSGSYNVPRVRVVTNQKDGESKGKGKNNNATKAATNAQNKPFSNSYNPFFNFNQNKRSTSSEYHIEHETNLDIKGKKRIKESYNLPAVQLIQD